LTDFYISFWSLVGKIFHVDITEITVDRIDAYILIDGEQQEDDNEWKGLSQTMKKINEKQFAVMSKEIKSVSEENKAMSNEIKSVSEEVNSVNKKIDLILELSQSK